MLWTREGSSLGSRQSTQSNNDRESSLSMSASKRHGSRSQTPRSQHTNSKSQTPSRNRFADLARQMLGIRKKPNRVTFAEETTKTKLAKIVKKQRNLKLQLNAEIKKKSTERVLTPTEQRARETFGTGLIRICRERMIYKGDLVIVHGGSEGSYIASVDQYFPVQKECRVTRSFHPFQMARRIPAENVELVGRARVGNCEIENHPRGISRVNQELNSFYMLVHTVPDERGGPSTIQKCPACTDKGKCKTLLEVLNHADWDGGTPLHAAASAGAYELVRHLIRQKCNIEAVDQNGQTALHVATSVHGNVDVVREILDGAQRIVWKHSHEKVQKFVNAVDNFNRTALMNASMTANDDTILFTSRLESQVFLNLPVHRLEPTGFCAYLTELKGFDTLKMASKLLSHLSAKKLPQSEQYIETEEVHRRHKCRGCGAMPIRGPRWEGSAKGKLYSLCRRCYEKLKIQDEIGAMTLRKRQSKEKVLKYCVLLLVSDPMQGRIQPRHIVRVRDGVTLKQAGATMGTVLIVATRSRIDALMKGHTLSSSPKAVRRRNSLPHSSRRPMMGSRSRTLIPKDSPGKNLMGTRQPHTNSMSRSLNRQLSALHPKSNPQDSSKTNRTDAKRERSRSPFAMKSADFRSHMHLFRSSMKSQGSFRLKSQGSFRLPEVDESPENIRHHDQRSSDPSFTVTHAPRFTVTHVYDPSLVLETDMLSKAEAVVTLLLNNKANVNEKDMYNSSAYDYAQDNSYLYLLKMEEELDAAQKEEKHRLLQSKPGNSSMHMSSQSSTSMTRGTRSTSPSMTISADDGSAGDTKRRRSRRAFKKSISDEWIIVRDNK